MCTANEQTRESILCDKDVPVKESSSVYTSNLRLSANTLILG